MDPATLAPCSYISNVTYGTIHKGRPDRGGRGVGPKADIVREVAWIYYITSIKNSDKGGGGPITQKFCGRPLCMVPYALIDALQICFV